MNAKQAEFTRTFLRLQALMRDLKLKTHAIRADMDATLEHLRRCRASRQGVLTVPDHDHQGENFIPENRSRFAH